MSSQATLSTPETEPSSSPAGRPADSTTFIDTSGGLLSDQTIASLRQEASSHAAVRPAAFTLPGEEPATEAEIEEEIALAWEDLVERWDEVTQEDWLFEMDVSEARDRWILKLFEALGFEPEYQRAHLEVGSLDFDLSHRGWPEKGTGDHPGLSEFTAPVLHTVGPKPDRDHDLDEKTPDADRGDPSPHDALQEFLNASQQHLWGIVTDGVKLRVLRDFYHTYTRGYVEFDLENIFASRNYADFRALYRLCHASRFLSRPEGSLPEPVDPSSETGGGEGDELATPLERLYQTSLATGVKIGKELQSNVVEAIEKLGNGLLEPDIREELADGGREAAETYFRELLLVVYRILFLLYAEQRGMMPGRDSLYAQEYSLTKLRDRAERRRGQQDRNHDLWHGLVATFRLAEHGDEDLGVPAYNGMLFDSDRLELLDGAVCPNDALLEAVANLTLIEQEGVLQRISYADLGVEEVGAIYESLLEFTPDFARETVDLGDRVIPAGSFYLDDRGTERKETGSYYTPPELVQQIIQTSLEPVLEDRLDDAGPSKRERREALLDLDVCDPACGSGAFLIAATNYLGNRLAEIESEAAYPSEGELREARRTVLQNCIYGVDLNPMAVELAKVSLWIDTAVEDKPLNFLDHRIRTGNSLVGTRPELVDQGLPQNAYPKSQGRDWHPGNDLRKRVRKENKDRNGAENTASLEQWGVDRPGFLDIAEKLGDLSEESASSIEEKRAVYKELRNDPEFQREQLVHDAWTAAFFWPLGQDEEAYPTPKTIQRLRKTSDLSDPSDEDVAYIVETARDLSRDQNFFHWLLEFPRVYEQGGFDCIIGNPPWEAVELKETEFFATRRPDIADSSLTQAERQDLIEALEREDPELHTAYQVAKQTKNQRKRFYKHSGRFNRSTSGRINLYAPFSELGLEEINDEGRCGLIVPTGIAYDDPTKAFFQFLVDKKRLASLYDFVNEKNIFPGVDSRKKFCLFTMLGEGLSAPNFDLAFHLTAIDGLSDGDRIFQLSPEDIQLVNPNTRTCPTFPDQEHADLALKIYRNSEVLRREVGELSAWQIDIQRMFHAGDDSHLFQYPWDLDTDVSATECFWTGSNSTTYFPVFESKMMNQFDHRFATYEGVDKDGRRNKNPRQVEDAEKDDPQLEVEPPYWVAEEEYREKWREGDWHLAIRKVARADDSRTVIAAILPDVPTEDSLNQILGLDRDEAFWMLASLNSFPLDFIARQKIGGANLSHYVIKQLPVPPPARFREWELDGKPVGSIINGLVQKLTLTSDSMAEVADKLSSGGEIFSFTTPAGKPREEVRWKLEAILCHLYGLELDDLGLMFSSFKRLEKLERARQGEFRSKEEIEKKFVEMGPRLQKGS